MRSRGEFVFVMYFMMYLGQNVHHGVEMTGLRV